MSQPIIKKIIITTGFIIASNMHAAQEAELPRQPKMSPRLAHARHVQKIRTKRYDARQNLLADLEKGRDHSRLSTQIMKSVHSWSLEKNSNSAQLLGEENPNSAPLQADPEQAANKAALHEELLAHFAIQQALDPAQQFADSISAEYNS